MTIKILFLGANPSNTTHLALDREVREISRCLRISPCSERFDLAQEWAVRVGDLQSALLRHRPEIVHFSGHGRAGTAEDADAAGARRALGEPAHADAGRGEILLENEAGRAEPIAASALADLFRIVRGVRCVVLNACHSAAQAEAIGQHVDCVLGMGRAIQDSAAIAFAGAFYQGLAFGETVETAFELGKNQIALAGLSQGDVPTLLVRKEPSLEHALFRGAPGRSGPVSAARGVAQLPPNSLPPRRLFVGRTEELDLLEAALGRQGRVSLHGLGGVGKTALALEYAHRSATSYPGGIWWLSGAGKPEDALLRLAPTLRTVGPASVRGVLGQAPLDAPAKLLAHTVRLALQNHGEPSLLVLDNVDTKGWSEALPGGAVDLLLTTRDRRLGLGHCISVDPLPAPQAFALTSEIAGEPIGALSVIARRRVLVDLGGLPLAVEAAARAVEQWAGSWTEYQRLLQQEMEAVLDDALTVEDYPHGVFAALDLSILRCGPESAERRLLEGAAAFAPEGVPIAWAEQAAGLEPRGIEAKRALAALSGMGLVRVT